MIIIVRIAVWVGYYHHHHHPVSDVFPGCELYVRAAVSLIKNITGSVMHLLVFIRPRGTVPVDVAHSATPSADFNIPGVYETHYCTG